MLTFQEAEKIFETARNPHNGKPLCNNTRLHRRIDNDRSAYYAVQLHYTDVVEIYEDGSYVLNSGGWQTLTTKDRISRYGAGLICQRAFVWYWHPQCGYGLESWDKSRLVPFENGMKVTSLRALEEIYA